jgi:hypothetical protein
MMKTLSVRLVSLLVKDQELSGCFIDQGIDFPIAEAIELVDNDRTLRIVT